MIEYTGTFKVIRDIIDYLNSGEGSMPDPPAWNATDEYQIDQYVKKDDKTYKAIRYTHGDWNPNYWVEITDEFNEFFQTKPGKITDITKHSEIFNNSLANTASGTYSHAEGNYTQATGDFSHSEGNSTRAVGYCSHAEGNSTYAYGACSHAEGDYTITGDANLYGYSYGYKAHAEGSNTKAYGNYSHAEGEGTQAGVTDKVTYAAHAEGSYTKANANYSHAEGYNSEANGQYSHAEGNNTKANGDYSHAEGYGSKALVYAHAEGNYTEANGNFSHAEGANTKANGAYSHAEGINSYAEGYFSHAEGMSAKANGYYSHAEGESTHSNGSHSHAGGYSSYAGEENQTNADSSFAHGYNLQTCNPYEAAFGAYNNSLNEKTYINFYSENRAYATGARIRHEGIIYEANTDIASPSGEFDPTKWDDTGETYAEIGTLFSVGYGTYSNRANVFELLRDGSGYLNGNPIIALQPPSEDGTYTLKCTVTDGVPTYSWVVDT